MEKFILGGYTRRSNDGLYTIDFDSKEGKFSNKQLIANLNSPTYVTLNNDKDLLFAIHSEGDAAGIVAYKLVDGQWEELSRAFGSGGSACHLSFKESSQTIYAANYGEGSLDVYALEGNNLRHIQRVKHQGSSVHPNQDASHVHYGGLNQAQDLLFVCDLGTDYVSTYKIHEDGLLEKGFEVKLPDGTGPRHLVLSNDEKYAYVNGELNSSVNILEVGDDGHLSFLGVRNNIPLDEIEDSASAAIRLSSDGKFLYVSSRFYNAITVYSVDDNVIERIQVIDSNGEIPRDFNLNHTEDYLIVGHQDSDNLVLFRRDKNTGLLELDPETVQANECVCVEQA